MGSTFPRVKVWSSLENLTNEDLNAEFDNILDNLDPDGIDDYSVSVAQMKLTTDPGEVGSESQPTSLSGEHERLRFAIKEMKGTDEWYETADSDINQLTSDLDDALGIQKNRIISGVERSSASNYPIALQAQGGTDKTVVLKASGTDFVVFIDSVKLTVTTDLISANLGDPATSNNTALVDDTLLGGEEFTRTIGEIGTTLTIDAAGTEITTRVGSRQAFKIVGGGTEYFTAFVKSATELTEIRRGYYFDDTQTPIERTTITNNDTITIMKNSWIFLKNDSTLQKTVNEPIVDFDEPSSPATDDFWFDITNETWKIFNGSAFVASNSILIGEAFSDSVASIGARSYEPFASYRDTNTMDLDVFSDEVVRTRDIGAQLNVAGSALDFETGHANWDNTADLETGSVAADTKYYVYMSKQGEPFLSVIAPYDRDDMLGEYHPFNLWRLVGVALTDSSSDWSWVDNRYRIRSLIRANTTNGLGSDSSNKIRKWSTVEINQGSAFLLDNSVTVGANITVLERGFYAITYEDLGGSLGTYAVTLNQSDLTANVGSPGVFPQAEVLARSTATGAGSPISMSWTGRLEVRDVVRGSISGAAASTTTFGRFHIQKTGI